MLLGSSLMSFHLFFFFLTMAYPASLNQTTQGLCHYLEEEGGEEFKKRGVVIGRDHRKQVRHTNTYSKY